MEELRKNEKGIGKKLGPAELLHSMQIDLIGKNYQQYPSWN